MLDTVRHPPALYWVLSAWRLLLLPKEGASEDERRVRESAAGVYGDASCRHAVLVHAGAEGRPVQEERAVGPSPPVGRKLKLARHMDTIHSVSGGRPGRSVVWLQLRRAERP